MKKAKCPQQKLNASHLFHSVTFVLVGVKVKQDVGEMGEEWRRKKRGRERQVEIHEWKWNESKITRKHL